MLIVVILALGGLMHAARSFSAGSQSSAGVAISFGYLLLTAFFAGELFKKIRLPRLTGYLVTGVVVGPGVLDLVGKSSVDQLGLFSGIAVALIALTAGIELELRAMRPLFRSIGWISLVAIGGTTLLLGAVVFALRSWLPFMKGMTIAEAAVMSLVLGVVMVAQSPAVVVALKNEMAADGPVARTVLGVVVIADLVVILLFALTTTAAKSVLGGQADAREALGMLAWELFGSLVVGALIGAVLAVYLRKVKDGAAVFVLTVCFVVAEVGRLLHFDPLLVALAAGIFIRNVTDSGDELLHEIEASALPVYIVFFAVAGATIHLEVLAVVGVPAGIFVIVRALGFLAGTRLGARIAGAPESVQRYAGFGLLPQAGLALALALLFAKSFPQFGDEAGALVLGVVTLNEILAPALYRTALVRCGEAGRDAGPVSAARPPAGEEAAQRA